MTRTPLITAAEAAEALASEAPPIILDVRYRLDAPDGSDACRAGHLPGAVYVSLDDDLAGHGAPSEGRHPLPSAEAFQASVRRWGLSDGDAVVVYDDWNSLAAARAWWMLADAGVDVRVLDGGLRAWRSAGLPVETGTVVPGAGTVTLHPGHLPHLDIDQAAALPSTGILLDVRAPERYRGEIEPIDAVAGHIPGARNAPSAANIDATGRLLPASALRELYSDLEGVEVGVYCGSGLGAAHTVLALTIAGHDAALYPGSWSQWTNTPGRPVAAGPTP